MPSTGYTGCSSGNYARRHNPWVDFSNIPAADNQPFTSFPSDYSTLPAVSFVVPNLQDDMHDGTIAQGDSWLSSNIDGYAQWAKTHNSILVLTWDEDDYSQSNQVPTIVVGSGVKPGSYNEQINHYTVLRTIEDAYGLGHLGSSAGANPITDIWTSSSTGSALVSAASGRCIDDPAFSTTPGTQVEIWDCNGGANQQWTAHPDGSLTTEGLCLDANGGGTTPGTKVILWSCNGGTNQQWTLNSDGTIHGVGSLLCLDVTGAATTNGTPLELWTCNGGTNQQWTHG